MVSRARHTSQPDKGQSVALCFLKSSIRDQRMPEPGNYHHYIQRSLYTKGLARVRTPMMGKATLKVEFYLHLFISSHNNNNGVSLWDYKGGLPSQGLFHLYKG